MRWMNAHYTTASLIFMVWLLSGCGSGGGGGGGTVGDVTVVVDSGKNQYISTGSRTLLDASDSQGFDGQQLITVNYLWQIVSKPGGSQVDLADNNIVTPFFIPDVNGEYEFKLTISKEGETETSTVKVVASSGNSRPMVEAGKDRQTIPGQAITLDGSRSRDANGDTLSYDWTLIDKPSASRADLTDSKIPKPQLTPDVAGIYKVELVVSDGQIDSEVDTITIEVKEGNVKPLALAGDDLHDKVGQEVQLSGDQSSDVNGDDLQYRWFFSSIPAASQVSLNDASSVTPIFIPDQAGIYLLTLQTTDVLGETDFDSVVVFITATNDLPVAHAGFDQTVNTGEEVKLNGAGSYDVNQDELTYQWRFAPEGNQGDIQQADKVIASFIPSVAGNYIAELVVNDGTVDSPAVSVTVMVEPPSVENQIPVAVVIPMTTPIPVGNTINLDGSTSGDGLTYQWTVIKPDGSNAELDVTTPATPSFVVDQVGEYQVQLIVNDGTADSQPDNITITSVVAEVTIPTANAGNAQTVTVGSSVTLDGSQSTPNDESKLNYAWAMSKPEDSQAQLSDNNIAKPTFIADVAGNYEITLVVTNGSGETNSSVVVVTVNSGTNTPPTINRFSVTPDTSNINRQITFSWDLSDLDGDVLTCQLDVNGDDTNDYTIDDCANTASQTHTFLATGNYTARLTVSDGIDTPVLNTVSVTINQTTAPLVLDVSTIDPVAAGGRLLYTITVSNVSAELINDVSVVYTVPPELRFHYTVDAEPNAAGCGWCENGIEASWALGTLVAGESRTITINAPVLPGVLAGTLISAPVRVTSPDVINNITVSKVVEVNNSPMSQLAMSASKDPVIPGESLSYQFDIGNIDAEALTGLELRVTLPTGVTVDVNSISDSGTEDGSTGEIVWAMDSLAVGNAIQREVTVIVDTDAIAGQILATRAELRHAGGISLDTSAEHAVTVVDSRFPITVDISATPDPVVANRHLRYDITVSNVSAILVNTVGVQLRVPPELRFHYTIDAEPNAAGCGWCENGLEAFWALGTLAAGESRTITINAPVLGDVLAGALISIPVRVTSSGSTNAKVIDNVHMIKTIAVNNSPMSQLAMSASKDPVIPGESLSYQFDIGNIDAEALTGLELRVTLPAGVTVDAGSINDSGVEDGSTGEIVWAMDSLAVGNAIQREVTVIVGTDAIAGQILATRAELRHDGGVSLDTSAEHAVTVVDSRFPITVDISATPDPVVANGHLRYDITISNVFAVPVNTVGVQLRVPPELRFHFTIDAEPNAAGCGWCENGLEAFWALGTLAAGESRTITINAPVLGDVLAGALISIPVRVTSSGSTNAKVIDNVHMIKTVAVNNSPMSQLAMSASKDPVMPGESLSYQFDIGNIDAEALTGLELRVTLPAGVTVDVGSINDSGVEDGSTGEIVWAMDSLAVGNAIQREVTVIVGTDAIAGQILATRAELRHDGGVSLDTSAEHAVTVVDSRFPITVDISTTPDSVVADGGLRYEITVSNVSAVPINMVGMQLRVPPELRFHYVDDAEPNAAGCGWCENGLEAFWALGTLAADERRTITINASVLPDVLAGALISAAVRVTSSGSTNVQVIDNVNRINITAVSN